MAEFNIKGPKKPAPKVVGAGPISAVAVKGPKKVEKQAPPPSNFGPLEWITDAMRGFNDTLTFGLYDDLLTATGVDPEATKKLENADPVASTIGKIGGYVVPGAGASKLASKIPGLAANTIPRIFARESIASGGLSAADDLIRTGEIDPYGVALDAGMGGVLSGVIAAGSRAISPTARVRAMGKELSPADKEAAEGFAKYADDQGIPLTVPEAVGAVVPSKVQTVKTGMAKAARSPSGAEAVSSFNEARKPAMASAGKAMIDEILGGKPLPTNAQINEAAGGAIEDVASGFRTTADPYYAQAETRNVPPSWVPKGGALSEAVKYVSDSPTFQKGLNRTAGLPKGAKVPKNSVLVLDAVKKRMDDMAATAASAGRTNESTFIAQEIDDLLNVTDKVAPSYPVARGIAEQGIKTTEGLRAGPLGTLAAGGNPKTLTGALFSGVDGPTLDASIDAMSHLPSDLPSGILARQLDAAVNKSPGNFANTALPSAYAEDAADAALSMAGKDSVIPKIKAAKAVNNRSPEPFVHENTGPQGTLWSAVRDLGQGKVAEKLLDNRYISKLNQMGPVQSAVTNAGRGAVMTAGDERRSKKKKKEPISIFVGGGRNSTP